MSEDISANSTKEEIANYFMKEFRISEENKNTLIKNDISGDILLEIKKEDFLSLGIKRGPALNIISFITKNAEKFKQNEINEKITLKSDAEKVKTFFEKCLNYKEDLNGLDGKELIELDKDEERIKKLGLNFGQTIKLKRYIAYFKTLEEEEDEDEDIIIDENSSDEDVEKFLRIKCKLSKKTINALGLDARSLLQFDDEEIDEANEIKEEEKETFKLALKELKRKLNLTVNENSSQEEVAEFLKIKLKVSKEFIQKNDFDGSSLLLLEHSDILELEDLTQEQKEKLIKIVDELKQKQNKKEQEQIITFESSKEEVSKFLKEKLEFNDKLIKKLDLDGEILFLLDENDIKEMEDIPKEKRMSLINILNKINYKINKESEKEEVSEFLKINLQFDNNSINNIGLDGEELFQLKEEDIDNMKIKEKEKEKLKKYLKNMNIKITKTSNEIDVLKYLKINLGFSYKSIKQLNFNGEKILLLDEEEIENLKGIKEEEKRNLEKFIKEIKDNKNGIQELNQNSKYNIFFILSVKENYKQYLSIRTYSESGYFTTKYIKIENEIIDASEYISEEGEKIKLFMFHAFSDEKISNLAIFVDDKLYNLEHKCNIDIKIKNDIYFYVQNLFFGEKAEEFYEIPIRIIFNNYLSYFYSRGKNININFKSYSLKSLLNKIKYSRNIELSPKTTLKLFKFCCEMEIEPKYIYSLNIIYDDKIYDKKKYILNKKYYISDEDIEKFKIKNKKSKFLELLMEIYANYDINYLLDLMQSKNGDIYSKIVLDLIYDNKVKLHILFEKEKDFKIFQKKLLSVSQYKSQVNYIIKLSKGLYNNLVFIKENFQLICKILEDYDKIYRKTNTDLKLRLDNPEKDSDIDKIFIALSDIVSKNKGKYYRILDYNEIFESLVNFYSNRELNELCKIHNILGILRQEKLNEKLIDYFYNKIHEKGLFLIKNKSLNSEDIINFIVAQDAYYFNSVYKTDEFRDPEIFKYIIITDENKDYKKIIGLIKKYKLWDVFSNKKTKFYEILVNQMEKIKDFESLFDIFSIKDFDREFTFLINGKIRDVIYSVLEEKKENYEKIFKIFDNWIIINLNLGLDMNYVIEILEVNYEITSKYYFHLLKSKEMQKYINDLKNYILNFFLDQNKKGASNAESLISLLLIAPNEQFLIYFLNQLNGKILTEKEFYQKEETDNYLLFKLFFQKCTDLIKNKRILEGHYLKETVKIRNKIFNDLKDNNVSYNTINNLMEEEKNFYNKILVMTGDEKETKNFYDKFKENMEKCNKKFKELENIKDFYTAFYNNTKFSIIILIKKKIAELKNKNISEISNINLEKCFEYYMEFNYQEAKKESEKFFIFYGSIFQK